MKKGRVCCTAGSVSPPEPNPDRCAPPRQVQKGGGQLGQRRVANHKLQMDCLSGIRM